MRLLFLQENVTINGQSCANKMGTLIQTGCGYEKRFQGPIFQKRKVLAGSSSVICNWRITNAMSVRPSKIKTIKSIIPPFTSTSSHTPSHIYNAQWADPYIPSVGSLFSLKKNWVWVPKIFRGFRRNSFQLDCYLLALLSTIATKIEGFVGKFIKSGEFYKSSSSMVVHQIIKSKSWRFHM